MLGKHIFKYHYKVNDNWLNGNTVNHIFSEQLLSINLI